MNHERIHGKAAIGTIARMGGTMSLPAPFVDSWTDLQDFSRDAMCGPGDYIHRDRASFSLHWAARNELAARMRGDWLLMLDTDITFEPDLAARLVRFMTVHDLDVVSGIYSYKAVPACPVLFLYNSELGRGEPILDWDHSLDLFEYSGGGAGCLLIRRRVFDRIQNELHEGPFDQRHPLGEDQVFYARCREIGVKCWCAWRCQCGHLDYTARRMEVKNQNRDRYRFEERQVEGIGVAAGDDQIRKGA